jgi:hypothetical protein
MLSIPRDEVLEIATEKVTFIIDPQISNFQTADCQAGPLLIFSETKRAVRRHRFEREAWRSLWTESVITVRH